MTNNETLSISNHITNYDEFSVALTEQCLDQAYGGQDVDVDYDFALSMGAGLEDSSIIDESEFDFEPTIDGE